jgi:hypothetical protein
VIGPLVLIRLPLAVEIFQAPDAATKARKHMSKKRDEPIRLTLNGELKGELKPLGGSKSDEWNNRLNSLVVSALPIVALKDREQTTEAAQAVSYGTMDISPADPIEGMLIAQLIAANDASLALYRKGWQNMPEYFDAGTKYLQLADRAARTVALLTERLDHHRGRGQQQIAVKHVTTNNVTADQAIIADSVTTGAARNVASPALLAASSEIAMPNLSEARLPDPVGVGGVEKNK